MKMERQATTFATMNKTAPVPIIQTENEKSGLENENDRFVYEINLAGVGFIICLFGIVASIISAVIFFKHGLNSTVNITLFSLSVSDFCGMTTLAWFGLSLNSLIVHADTAIYSEEIGYMTGSYPHACFSRITSWLTAFITAERCLCIALPLKSKQIITPKRTALILCIIVICNCVLMAPQYVVTDFVWGADKRRNKTVLRISYKKELLYLEALSFIVNAVNGLVSFIAVTIFTIILIIKLGQQRAWRKSTVVQTDRNKSSVTRDKRTGFMVLMISCLLIFCYLPIVTVSMAMFIGPDFTIIRSTDRGLVVSWSFCFILEAINASSSIFFYLKMSTKYKKTFKEMFALGNKRNTLSK